MKGVAGKLCAAYLSGASLHCGRVTGTGWAACGSVIADLSFSYLPARHAPGPVHQAHCSMVVDDGTLLPPCRLCDPGGDNLLSDTRSTRSVQCHRQRASSSSHRTGTNYRAWNVTQHANRRC